MITTYIKEGKIVPGERESALSNRSLCACVHGDKNGLMEWRHVDMHTLHCLFRYPPLRHHPTMNQ